MKFFIPMAKDEEEAESVYRCTVEFAESQGWSITPRRIFSVRWNHEGVEYYAEVGKAMPRLGEIVIAILESRAYLVCTGNRGVARGEPAMIGLDEVISITNFEQHQ